MAKYICSLAPEHTIRPQFGGWNTRKSLIVDFENIYSLSSVSRINREADIYWYNKSNYWFGPWNMFSCEIIKKIKESRNICQNYVIVDNFGLIELITRQTTPECHQITKFCIWLFSWLCWKIEMSLSVDQLGESLVFDPTKLSRWTDWWCCRLFHSPLAQH